VIVSRALSAQPAGPQDAARLQAFLARVRRLHQHLDWHLPAAWLGRRPFYFALDDRGQLAGVLAAPPDPPDTAWLRLLAVADGIPAGDVLRAVWPLARRDLERDSARLVAALAVEAWVGPALAAIGFQNTNEVIVLSRELGSRQSGFRAPNPQRAGGLALRPFHLGDLAAAAEIDYAAFVPPWQVSMQALGLALQEAGYATVAEVGQPPQLAGFQLSTESRGGGHLARLAVVPHYQGRGIATALVADALAHFGAARGRRLTVNTQRNNTASLHVYERLGFQRTGEGYALWQLTL